MSDGVEETFNAVELDGGNAKPSNTDTKTQETNEVSQLAQAEKGSAPAMPKPQEKENRWVNAVDQFKIKKFFVLRVLSVIYFYH